MDTAPTTIGRNLVLFLYKVTCDFSQKCPYSILLSSSILLVKLFLLPPPKQYATISFAHSIHTSTRFYNEPKRGKQISMETIKLISANEAHTS